MLPTKVQLFPIDVGQEHHRRVISTVASEIMKILAQFLALDITVICVSVRQNCGTAYDF